MSVTSDVVTGWQPTRKTTSEREDALAGHCTVPFRSLLVPLILISLLQFAIGFAGTSIVAQSRISHFSGSITESYSREVTNTIVNVFHDLDQSSTLLLQSWTWDGQSTSAARKEIIFQMLGDPLVASVQCATAPSRGNFVQLRQSPTEGFWEVENASFTNPDRRFVCQLDENGDDVPSTCHDKGQPQRRKWFAELNSSVPAFGSAYVKRDYPGHPVVVPFGGQINPQSNANSFVGVCVFEVLASHLTDILVNRRLPSDASAVVFSVSTGAIIATSWNQSIVVDEGFSVNGLLGDPSITFLNLSSPELSNSLIKRGVAALGYESLVSPKHYTGPLSRFDIGSNFQVAVGNVLIEGADFRTLVVLRSQSDTTSTQIAVSIVVIIVFIVAFTGEILVVNVVVGRFRQLTKELDEIASIENSEYEGPERTTSMISEIGELEAAIDRLRETVNSFLKYVPKQIVVEMLYKGASLTAMHHANCAILFANLQDFTSIIDSMNIDEVSHVVTVYFNVQTRIIHEHGGLIDKILGDSIMAVWGAPRPIDIKEVRASLAGLQLCHAVNSPELKRVLEKKVGREFRVRVGIATGGVYAGNVGGEDRVTYSVLGDPVVLAARLEPLNKVHNTRLLVSEAVASEIEPVMTCRAVDGIRYIESDPSVTLVCEILGLRPVVRQPHNAMPSTSPQPSIQAGGIQTPTTQLIPQSDAMSAGGAGGWNGSMTSYESTRLRGYVTPRNLPQSGRTYESYVNSNQQQQQQQQQQSAEPPNQQQQQQQQPASPPRGGLRCVDANGYEVGSEDEEGGPGTARFRVGGGDDPTRANNGAPGRRFYDAEGIPVEWRRIDDLIASTRLVQDLVCPLEAARYAEIFGAAVRAFQRKELVEAKALLIACAALENQVDPKSHLATFIRRGAVEAMENRIAEAEELVAAKKPWSPARRVFD